MKLQWELYVDNDYIKLGFIKEDIVGYVELKPSTRWPALRINPKSSP
ncbi:MAG: hypothetical protein ACTINA_14295 [Pseudoalteromonas distincta]